MKTLQGIPAAPGLAVGPVYLFRRSDLTFEKKTSKNPDGEWRRFLSALETVSRQCDGNYAQAKTNIGNAEAEIFLAHKLILEDPELHAAVKERIHGQALQAESAVRESIEEFASQLEQIKDDYLRARATDIRDVGSLILGVLLNAPRSSLEGLTVPSIILAQDLTPSDTILLDPALVLGLCIALGGATSHTAILAQGMGIPAVVGVGEAVLSVEPDTQAIIDGGKGILILDPDQQKIDDYRAEKNRRSIIAANARKKAFEPAVTLDRKTIEVGANIGSLAEARNALRQGADGVGLFRTEFVYLESSHLPDEEEQYRIYRQVLDEFGEKPFILRTLDVGGDKEIPYLELQKELNPFLGVRGLRLCLSRPELFRPQLRAALRASPGHNLKLMLPMVSTVGEVRAARQILDSCLRELEAEGKPVAESLQFGIMVEVPSVALCAKQLATEVDFFSIGSNDLSQYTMAADRTNAGVAHVVSAFQPAVLQLMRATIEGARSHGKWVGICGGMAADPLAIPLLVGLGLDELSVPPSAIAQTKELIRSISFADACWAANEAFNFTSPEEIQQFVQSHFKISL